MKLINAYECSLASGAGADSYRLAVSLEIANAMAKKFGQCNVGDFSDSVLKSAVASGLLGSMGSAVAVPGIDLVPGWIAGAAGGAAGAAFTYGLTCWW